MCFFQRLVAKRRRSAQVMTLATDKKRRRTLLAVLNKCRRTMYSVSLRMFANLACASCTAVQYNALARAAESGNHESLDGVTLRTRPKVRPDRTRLDGRYVRLERQRSYVHHRCVITRHVVLFQRDSVQTCLSVCNEANRNMRGVRWNESVAQRMRREEERVCMTCT